MIEFSSETLTHKGQWPLPSKALHVWGLVCLEALKKALSCAWLRARPDSRVAMQVPMMMICSGASLQIHPTSFARTANGVGRLAASTTRSLGASAGRMGSRSSLAGLRSLLRKPWL